MFIPGLRREMRVLALLLIVYFMSLTWTAVSSEAVTTANSTTSAGKTSTKISPTSTRPVHISTSTIAPSVPSTAAPIKQITTPVPTTGGRKFDGASFAGGIILGIVIAIIFILAFKWWQSRNKSYHSL